MAVAKPCHFDKFGQLKVLSVDDDAVNLMVMEQLLSPQGWQVVSAADGDEALEVLEHDETWPDFVFLDYQMNTGDYGDKICQKMRQLLGGVDIPIVMCTAMAEGSSVLQLCKDAGATDHLLKPYERTRMLEKIERYCGHKVKATQTARKQPITSAKAAPNMPAQPPTASQPPKPVAAAAGALVKEDVMSFCVGLDLEYCGWKLQAAGVDMTQLKSMDDKGLRKAGLVVKAQRDKILAAASVVGATEAAFNIS